MKCFSTWLEVVSLTLLQRTARTTTRRPRSGEFRGRSKVSTDLFYHELNVSQLSQLPG